LINIMPFKIPPPPGFVKLPGPCFFRVISSREEEDENRHNSPPDSLFWKNRKRQHPAGRGILRVGIDSGQRP